MIYPTNNNRKIFAERNGTLKPAYESFTKQIDGSGVWRVKGGRLLTTITSSPAIEKKAQHSDEILSLTSDIFSYRSNRGGPTNTAFRKQ